MADDHMGAANRTKSAQRAAKVAPEIADGCTRLYFEQVAQAGGRAVVIADDTPPYVTMASVGLGLIGQPELKLRWPVVHAQKARCIFGDLIDQAYFGRKHHDLPYDGKQVMALAYDLSYTVVAEPDPSNEFGHGLITEATKAYRPKGAARQFELVFHADLREGVVLPGGVPGTLPRFESKNGVQVFTGLVELPVPSRTWSLSPFERSIAKLVDPDGPYDGPHTILTPPEFLELMDAAGYD